MWLCLLTFSARLFYLSAFCASDEWKGCAEKVHKNINSGCIVTIMAVKRQRVYTNFRQWLDMYVSYESFLRIIFKSLLNLTASFSILYLISLSPFLAFKCYLLYKLLCIWFHFDICFEQKLYIWPSIGLDNFSKW